MEGIPKFLITLHPVIECSFVEGIECLIVFFLRPFQTCFVNNPISGGLTLAATFVTGWKIGIGTLLGGSVATISEMVIAPKKKGNIESEKCRIIAFFRVSF